MAKASVLSQAEWMCCSGQMAVLQWADSCSQVSELAGCIELSTCMKLWTDLSSFNHAASEVSCLGNTTSKFLISIIISVAKVY